MCVSKYFPKSIYYTLKTTQCLRYKIQTLTGSVATTISNRNSSYIILFSSQIKSIAISQKEIAYGTHSPPFRAKTERNSVSNLRHVLNIFQYFNGSLVFDTKRC